VESLAAGGENTVVASENACATVLQPVPYTDPNSLVWMTENLNGTRTDVVTFLDARFVESLTLVGAGLLLSVVTLSAC
jgi:hypothetical protein